VAIRQGLLASNDDPNAAGWMISAGQAAKRLGISRAAVVKAAREGRIKDTP
jgi:hypothetical protein